MNFNFDGVVSQNTVKKVLDGNKIHNVTFDGCVIRDFNGTQDPSKTFKTIDIKFSNDEGVFTHTVFEPVSQEDFEDGQNNYGPTPSRVKQYLCLFKHLIDAVNPELAKEINNKTKSLNAPNWDALRKLVVDSTNPGIGTKTQIKLFTKVKDGNTTSVFPAYFLNYNRDGVLYMSTNFIGDHLFFTKKEISRIESAAVAKPTTDIEENSSKSISNDDFNFEDF